MSIVDAQLISYLSVQALVAPADVRRHHVFWHCRPPGQRVVLLLPRIVFVSSSVIWASFWMLVYYLWHDSKTRLVNMVTYLLLTCLKKNSWLWQQLCTAYYLYLKLHKKKIVVLICDWYYTVNRVPNTTHNVNSTTGRRIWSLHDLLKLMVYWFCCWCEDVAWWSSVIS